MNRKIIVVDVTVEKGSAAKLDPHFVQITESGFDISAHVIAECSCSRRKDLISSYSYAFKIVFIIHGGFASWVGAHVLAVVGRERELIFIIKKAIQVDYPDNGFKSA